MESTMVSTLVADFATAIEALGRVSKNASDYALLDDSQLKELARLAGVERQLVDAHSAVIGGEVGHRSAVSLGSSGLAQSEGFRTPEEFLRATSRATGRDASTSVRVGRFVRESQMDAVDPRTGEVAPAARPWLACVSAAITAGTLPASSADSIASGLGEPSGLVTVQLLADAAEQLCLEALTLDPDRLFKRARQLRDEIDLAGVAEREHAMHERRSLRLYRQPDGTTRLVWIMDTETAAVITELYDRATSPRLGGPRFRTDSEQAELAAAIEADARTPEQLASDVFAELLRHGANADDSQLLGTGAPAIRVHVTAEALNTGVGFATIEGQPNAISIPTVERLICSGSTTSITFGAALVGTGEPLDVGREQRLYTRRQRIALAARDGGCRFPGCERPPSWTEAHHTKFWKRDHGGTAVEDGVLLCRHHHLHVHNNGWEIERRGFDFALIPPPNIDPTQTPRPMPAHPQAGTRTRP